MTSDVTVQYGRLGPNLVVGAISEGAASRAIFGPDPAEGGDDGAAATTVRCPRTRPTRAGRPPDSEPPCDRAERLRVTPESESVGREIYRVNESGVRPDGTGRSHVEHDVRRDADHLGGHHQPAEQPVQRRGRQLRAADGVDAGRAGQADGQSARDAGKAGRQRDQADRHGEGEGLAAAPDRRQPASGESRRPPMPAPPPPPLSECID